MIMHEPTVFELRTYTSYEGKLPEVLARFRDHVTKLFENHGMTNIAYWVPQDAPASQNTLTRPISGVPTTTVGLIAART